MQTHLDRERLATNARNTRRSAPTPPTAPQEMGRALFVFAKLNPGLRYVQGMNELLAPIYWLFATGGPLVL